MQLTIDRQRNKERKKKRGQEREERKNEQLIREGRVFWEISRGKSIISVPGNP